ncbi:NADH-quinone oxidoreductase subunit C [Candidatus Viridilinea mediisalina]|uniref:NADH-quinone oxidoreductase n=1 Tax=Candidatus Viridilinea mediisalina TaxID=2024553 RepID=A0A2A6RM56_9CHLR|nr:NADH-quinone oxidoreductase subunit C [Candidatus Viridilinea mediisalina]PDW03968.1 NADH-quinone oxidoreductase subunit C [Candidatus Viridilinea mediisalina]
MTRLDAAALRERMQNDLPDALVEPAPLKVKAAHGAKTTGFVTDDTLIAPEHLIAAALYLRDTLGYAYLSDIAVVDYIADDLFELGYRFYHVEGGPALVLKIRVPRDTPEVPALTPVWPGANFHEREAFDLYGIIFTDHPFLRRIYLWDEFEGFPMRKDFPKQGDKYIGEDE